VQAILNLIARMNGNKSPGSVGLAGGFNFVMTVLGIGDFKSPGTIGFAAEFYLRDKWCKW
jgi:hypothetical protein